MMATPNMFYDEWFSNPDWWFSKNPVYDEYIKNTYEHLLETSFDLPIEGLDLIKQSITNIIIFDQLPRHVFRNQRANHIIEYFLQKALEICEIFMNKSPNYGDFVSDQEWSFVWLPFRHTRNLHNIFKAMEAAWARLNKKPDGSHEHLKRFIKATYQNCPKDAQPLDVSVEISDMSFEKFRDVIDEKITLPLPPQPQFTFGDVLGFWEGFPDKEGLIVSLSGGVDSMVLLDHIINLYPNKKIAAVHINYCNRETSNLEADFVKQWCSNKGVKLYTRNIREINRPMCMKHELRDTYETYTKCVRFGSYATAWADMGLAGNPIVLFGHNKDDCFENVLTNASFKTKYDNLCGMEFWSLQDMVLLGRPLLMTFKRDIVRYANTHNIPYVYDSTVSWCQRGKIRDTIVPVLNNWHQDAIDGIVGVAKVTRELYGILRLSVDAMIKDMICQTSEDGKMVIKSVTADKYPSSSLFWRDFMMRGLNIYPSNNSLENFMERINVFNTSKKINVSMKVQLKKNVKVQHKRAKDGKYTLSFLITL